MDLLTLLKSINKILGETISLRFVQVLRNLLRTFSYQKLTIINKLTPVKIF